MKAKKTKHFELDIDIFVRLIEASKKLGVSQTKIMEDALKVYLLEVEKVKTKERW